MPGVFSWLTPLLFLLGCWGCLFILMTAMWSYQRHVCLSTVYKKMCKNISMSTVNQWPLSAAWLWRLRHPSLCSPANGGLLDPRHKGPVWGTRDGCALSFWQGSQHPVCLVNGSLVVSCMCVDGSIFCPLEGNRKGTLQGVCSRILFMLFLKALEGIDLLPPCLDWTSSIWHSRWTKSEFTF